MYCFNCGQALNDRPELIILGNSYCFKCAKARYRNRTNYFKLQKECEQKSLYAIIAAVVGCVAFNVIGMLALAGTLYKRSEELKELKTYAGPDFDKNRNKTSWGVSDVEKIPIGYSYFKGIDREEVRLCDHALASGTRYLGAYDRKDVIKRYRNVCQICGKNFEIKDLEVHHVRPIQFQGSNADRNLVALCIPCHKKETWFGHYHAGNSRPGRSLW